MTEAEAAMLGDCCRRIAKNVEREGPHLPATAVDQEVTRVMVWALVDLLIEKRALSAAEVVAVMDGEYVGGKKKPRADR